MQLPQQAIFGAGSAVDIAQKREGEASQEGSPCLVTWNAIHADAQHLGIHPFEVSETRLQRRDLFRSAGCPVKTVEGQHDLLLSPEVAQANCLASRRGEGEIRRPAPD